MRLTATGIGCIRGGQGVFSGIDFSVDAGSALAVTGPNGTGKTTLLRVLAGLLMLSAGQFALEGGDPEATLGEQAHYLGHLDPFKSALSVSENLAFWSQFFGGSGATADALKAVGLDRVAELPASYLSAGQKRRLSLARLIAVPRPVWLLDEPLTSLDAAAQANLGELMRGHLSGGGIVVAATHAPLGLDGARELRMGSR